MQDLSCPISPFAADQLLSTDFMRCPYSKLGEMQDAAPVHQVEQLPWYLVTQYDACQEVLHNPKAFSSEFYGFQDQLAQIGVAPTREVAQQMKEIGGERGMMFEILLHRDPPAHTRL
jgi:cytochrome P450